MLLRYSSTELKEVVRKSEGRKKEFSQALKQEKQLLDDSVSLSLLLLT